MARIQIRKIFEGHFIRIFEYSNIRAHHCTIMPQSLLSPLQSSFRRSGVLCPAALTAVSPQCPGGSAAPASGPVRGRNTLAFQVQLVQYSTVLYSTVQYSTVQSSTVQYSTVHYSTVQPQGLSRGSIHCHFRYSRYRTVVVSLR